MPKKCMKCDEIYSLKRTSCPRCQCPEALVMAGAGTLGGRSLPGWALMIQGALLALGPHPESCLPALALGCLLLAGIDQAVPWSRVAAMLMVVAGPVAALVGGGPAAVLLAAFALILLWLLNDRHQHRFAAACIVLAFYYGAFTSIVVVLPRL
jgi:hypothetical protein